MMRLRPFILLCATGLCAIFSSTIAKSPVLPFFAAHLGAGPSTVGFIAAISAMAGVVFSVPAGLLADRFGARRLILAAAVIFATAPLGYLMVTEIWQLAVVRFYHGFATAIFVPVAMAMVSSLSDRERGEKLGWFSTATLAGRFMAPLVGGTLLGLGAKPAFGFRAVYVVCAGAGLVTLLLALFLPVPEKRGPVNQSWPDAFRAFRTVLRSRTIVATCLVEASILFAYGTFETFLPLHALAQGLNAAQVGVFLSGQVIVLALTKPVMGRFSDRHGRRPQIVTGALLGAVCIGGFALCHGFFAMLGLSIAFGLCLSVVTSATSAYIGDLSSAPARGSAMGLLGSIMDIGHSTGPLLTGIIASAWGYGPAFAGAALVAAGVAAAFTMTTDKTREDMTNE